MFFGLLWYLQRFGTGTSRPNGFCGILMHIGPGNHSFACFVDILLAFGNIVELDAAVSKASAALAISNLSFSMVLDLVI